MVGAWSSKVFPILREYFTAPMHWAKAARTHIPFPTTGPHIPSYPPYPGYPHDLFIGSGPERVHGDS